MLANRDLATQRRGNERPLRSEAGSRIQPMRRRQVTLPRRLLDVKVQFMFASKITDFFDA
jgi:hypothetical protein